MQRICKNTNKSFVVSEAEQDYCARNDISLPLISPPERLRNMLIFRNRTFLYHDTCGLSGQKILSCIPPERKFNVYDVDVWQSEEWDPLSFGREYNFSRSFFSQFVQLYREIPHANLSVVRPTMENSDYTNGITHARNCYLLFSAVDNENCMFSYAVWRSNNIFQSHFVFDSELCFACEDVRNCYDLKYSSHCTTCSSAAFLFNCHGCSDCYGCANLSHKQYYFNNKALTPGQYQKKLSEIDLGSHSIVDRELKRFKEFSKEFGVKYYFGKNNENSSGNFINNTKNCANCYFCSNAEDLNDCLYVDDAKSSILHAMFGHGSELIYNSCAVGGSIYNLKFTLESWQGVHDLEYCTDCCFGTNNCFGCVGLKKASYCILNKQYPKNEYLELRDRIKQQMKQSGDYGKFFPSSMSPFFFNQSDASQYYPLDKNAALKAGFRWTSDSETDTSTGDLPPDNIADVADSVLDETFTCALSFRPYRVIRPELKFYRKHKVPIPRIAPMERIKNSRPFFIIEPLKPGSCCQCGQSFLSVYGEQQRKLYCEGCFQKEVFG